VTNHHIGSIALKVRERFSERLLIAYAELLGELDLELGIVLIPNTVCHIIARLPFCKIVTGLLQGASRVQYNQWLGYVGTIFLILDGFSCQVRDAIE
jgi:hypothetical protein